MNYFSVSLILKFKEAELIQYLNPDGWGPSSNTWPK